MAAPPAFSTYVALSQERQARSVELRRAAFIVTGVVAVALVAMVYLNFRTQVVIRGEQVQLMVNQRTELTNRNQELAYRIAWESAPQRLEERAAYPISSERQARRPCIPRLLSTLQPLTRRSSWTSRRFLRRSRTGSAWA
jgi:hypothetical protein